VRERKKGDGPGPQIFRPGTAGVAHELTRVSLTVYSGTADFRRKNASRESTSLLKAWLYWHIKNPYPSKAEKVAMAIITKMSLTQVQQAYYFYNYV